MRDVIPDIDRWLATGEVETLVATVIETWGSAPRKAGAKMAFTGNGQIAGSVSGGCVEGAVVEAGQAVLATGEPRLLQFGVADETAWSVGLACGGRITVLVERLDLSIYEPVRAAVLAGEPVTVLTGLPDAVGAGGKLVWRADGQTAGDLLDRWRPAAVELIRATTRPSRAVLGEQDVFVDRIAPPPQLVMVGGAHIAVALAKMARVVGYGTIVIDPRRAFGSADRFPDVDRLLQAWPTRAFAAMPINEETAVVTLSHDPKIDDPALAAALGSPAFYIGALGSRSTHAKRCARLADQGFTEADLDRIHAPVGLDIGGDNPEEIALAIMAEVVAAHRKR